MLHYFIIIVDQDIGMKSLILFMDEKIMCNNNNYCYWSYDDENNNFNGDSNKRSILLLIVAPNKKIKSFISKN